MRTVRGILIPNFQSSYAIESKVEGIKDWQMSCNTMGKECPCEVIIANESAVIMFDKDIQPGSYDMDIEYMNTVISDIREARELDVMENPAMESIYVIDEKSNDVVKNKFTEVAAKYLDKFALEELSLIGLNTVGMESGEVEVPSPQPAVPTEVEEVIESPVVAENEPNLEEVAQPEPAPVQVSESEDGKKVEIVQITEDDALQVKEFLDGLKAMNMTVSDFLLAIKSIKAYMSTVAKVNPEPVEEIVEETPAEVPAPEDVVGAEDYSYQDAVPYPSRPGADPQSVNGGVSDIAETEDIQAKAGEVLANESADPYAGLDNSVEPTKPETIGMESVEEQTPAEPVEEEKEDVHEDATDPEDLFNEPEEVATESIDDSEPFIMTLAKEAHNDSELFDLMMEHKAELPQEILMESVNINMYEKLINNVIINTNAVEKIKRGMRINN